MNQVNLLQNGEFAAGSYAYRNNESLTTAVNWAPWWLENRPDMPQWRNQQPDYRLAEVDGFTAQCVSTPYGTHVAGLFQQIPTAPGNRYELTVSAQAWSSEEDTPGKSVDATDLNVRIGIDPAGGLDPTSPLIIWSDPVQPLDRWLTMRLTVQVEALMATVYLESAPLLPKRNQEVYWREAVMLPVGRFQRSRMIVGPGDTHIVLNPEHPTPDELLTITVSATRNHPFVELLAFRPDGQTAPALFQGASREDDRYLWRYELTPSQQGLYDLRFVGDQGARLLAQRLVRASRQTQIVPSNEPRTTYRRVYVLMPPTATQKWVEAAARGSFPGRYTIGFSADDAGLGELNEKIVVAVNPHHWPNILTISWFQQNYPGTIFLPVVANSPADLETWLSTWSPEQAQSPAK
jgi:hypothetical protein